MPTEVLYLAIAEDAQDGSWSAYVPDLPGCTAGGATAEEALRDVEVSISLWLEEARGGNVAIPRPRAQARHIAG